MTYLRSLVLPPALPPFTAHFGGWTGLAYLFCEGYGSVWFAWTPDSAPVQVRITAAAPRAYSRAFGFTHLNRQNGLTQRDGLFGCGCSRH